MHGIKARGNISHIHIQNVHKQIMFLKLIDHIVRKEIIINDYVNLIKISDLNWAFRREAEDSLHLH